MCRRLAVIVSAVLGVLLALLGSFPAVAQDQTGRISSITVEPGTISLSFTGSNLPEGETIDPASVQVSLDEAEVETTAEPITEAVEPPLRTTMLVIDTSGSMADDGKLDGAKSAAAAFLDQVPDDVLVGLVSFEAQPTVQVQPTTDRQEVRDAVGALQAGGDTSLYDAIIQAAQATGTEGVRSAIILSDGEDTTSQATLQDAVAGVTDAAVQADAIAVGAGADDAISALTQITAATGGVVVQVDEAADLAGFFEVAAEALTNELAVTATVPDDFTATSATLTVIGTAGEQTVAASAFITVVPGGGTEARPVPPEAYGPIAVAPPESILSEGVASWVLPLAIVAIGLGVFGVVGLAVLRVTRDKTGGVTGRLSIYTLAGSRPKRQQEVTSTALGESAVARSAVELADRVVKQRNYEDDLAQRLDAAGLPLRSAEWVLIQAGIAIGLGLLVLLISGFNVIAAVIALVLGVLGPYVYLNMKASRRRSKFVSQLPDTLQLMAGSMEAGYSLPQAVDTVVREDIDPVSSEFNRALIESRLGVPVEDALETVGERMQSQDFDWVVMAIRIQRQVGGSLADVLKTVANTLREREQLRRTVRALSADGRLSAWIVGLAPFFVAMFLIIFNPAYIQPLFQDPLGWIMIGVALVLIAIGVFIITRIIKVEI